MSVCVFMDSLYFSIHMGLDGGEFIDSTNVMVPVRVFLFCLFFFD